MTEEKIPRSLTLEEAKIKYAHCWQDMMLSGATSDFRSFVDGYQCALRDCFMEYFWNRSPKQVQEEVRKME